MDLLFAFLVLFILGVVIPFMCCAPVWLVLGLHKRRLGFMGAALLFLVGAFTSFTFWGHAGPMYAPFMLWHHTNGEYLRWALWMGGSGLCMAVLFGIFSYRTSRYPPADLIR